MPNLINSLTTAAALAPDNSQLLGNLSWYLGGSVRLSVCPSTATMLYDRSIMGTISWRTGIIPAFKIAEPEPKLISEERLAVTPLVLVVTSTGFSPVSGFGSISFTSSSNAECISPRDIAWLSTSNFFPTDFPIESAICCNFTGSMVEIAASKTKNAKRSVIISAKVPNQSGSPSSTEPAPSS